MITSIECYYVYIHPKPFILSTECFTARHILFSNILWILSRIFPGMFGNISRNIWRHSPEYLATFPGIFGDIPRNVRRHSRNIWRHSPKYLTTFPGMFEDIPRNVWRHSSECLRTFPGMFGHIPRNIAFPVFVAFLAFRSPFLYSWFYT